MSTRAQRRAALRNAQLSTGPRTPEGKAASSRNAVKHNLSGAIFVLLPGEDQAAFEALARDYRDEWRPRTAHETFLVAQMVQARWRLNRIARMEALIIDAALEKFGEGRPDEGALVISENFNPDPMRRLYRYAHDAERSYNRAVRELQAYRKGQPQTIEKIAEPVAARPASASASTSHEEIQNEPEFLAQSASRAEDAPTPDPWLAARQSPLAAHSPF